MALNYVNLTVDIFDGSGNIPQLGTVTFTPSATLTDTTNHEIVAPPVSVQFRPGVQPVAKLLATDNATILPSGWAWNVTFSGPGFPAPYSIFLPFASGANQNLSSQSPVSSVVTMQAFMPLPSGTAVAGQVPVATGAGSASAWGQYPLMAKVADTGVNGFSLQNGTPNIMTWTAPNDGNQHFFMIVGQLHVTTTEVGGATQVTFTQPDGTATTTAHDAGSHAVSTTGLNFLARGIQPGTTVTYSQSSALTSGVALLFAAILGA